MKWSVKDKDVEGTLHTLVAAAFLGASLTGAAFLAGAAAFLTVLTGGEF
jgi:hypothetical protein